MITDLVCMDFIFLFVQHCVFFVIQINQPKLVFASSSLISIVYIFMFVSSVNYTSQSSTPLADDRHLTTLLIIYIYIYIVFKGYQRFCHWSYHYELHPRLGYTEFIYVFCEGMYVCIWVTIVY